MTWPGLHKGLSGGCELGNLRKPEWWATPLEGPPGLPRAGGPDAASPPDAGTHLCSSSSPLGGEAHPGGCWAQLMVFPEVTLPTEMATFK